MIRGLANNRALPWPVSEARAASTAGGGTALSTTAVRVVLPDKTQGVSLIPRNFSTAVVAQVAACPWLVVLKTLDDLLTVTDYSAAAQDDSAATDVVLSSMGALAAGDYLLIGSHTPFRGLAVDIDAANGTASVLTAKYWNGSAWTDISATDGTTSGGAAFAVDGNITWTVPTAWAKTRLREIQPASAAAVGPYQHVPLYWLRIEVSVAMDSSTTLNSVIAMPRSTAYAELPSGVGLDLSCQKGLGGIAAIEAKTDAGTANLIVNAYTWGEEGF